MCLADIREFQGDTVERVSLIYLWDEIKMSEQTSYVELSPHDPFVKMPVILLVDERLTANDKLVYLALGVFMNRQSRTCFPSVGTLVRASGLSKSTIFRGLKRLESLGLVQRMTQNGRSSLYTLAPVETVYRESAENWYRIRTDVRDSIRRRRLGRILQIMED